jgi:hypothetical protein
MEIAQEMQDAAGEATTYYVELRLSTALSCFISIEVGYLY